MREARLILPITDETRQIVGGIINDVVKSFNGVTVTEGFGRWKDDAPEEIYILDIAYEPTRLNDAELYDIAHSFRYQAKQETVYLRYGNGNVQLVTELGCMDNGEVEPFDWEALREDLHRAKDDPTDVPEVPEHVALI